MKLNINNPVFQFINITCNYIVLNLIFLITCLPIITIGTALSSLYYVTLKESRQEEGYLVRPYLKEFKRNMKSGTFAFLILFIIGMILVFNFTFWSNFESLISLVISLIIALVLAVYILICLFTFPLIGRFENKTFQTLKNAFYIAMTNLKYTLLLLLINMLVILLCFFVPQMKLFMVLIGFAFIAYCQSFLFTKIFTQYEGGHVS